MPPQTTKLVMLMLQAAAHSPHRLQTHLSCEAALTCEDNRAQLVYLPILVPHWRTPGPYATLMESFSCFLHEWLAGGHFVEF